MEVVFKDVSYLYDNNSIGLKDINVTLESNRIHGIIGQIGSGKSTFLELMNGVLKPSKGEILIGDYNLHSKGFDFNKFRYDVGIVYQFPENHFFSSTVAKEISFSSNVLNNKSVKKKVIDALKIVGLNDSYLKRNPLKLNGGEKRLIAIASVLISNPKVLILDEPTIGLDLKSKKRLINILKKLKTNHLKTIIIVTHDIDMAYELCDSIVLLNNGMLIKQGKVKEIFNDIKLLKDNNVFIPNIIKVKKCIYDITKKDLGDIKDMNDLIRKVSSLKKGDDTYE